MFYGLRELGYLKVKSLAKSHIIKKHQWKILKIDPRIFAVFWAFPCRRHNRCRKVGK